MNDSISHDVEPRLAGEAQAPPAPLTLWYRQPAGQRRAGATGSRRPGASSSGAGKGT